MTLKLDQANAYFLSRLQGDIQERVKQLFPDADVEGIMFSEPPVHIGGDIAFACFSLAATKEKTPAQYAEEIAEAFRKNPVPNVSRIDTAGAFVNLYLDWAYLVGETLLHIQKLGDRYGENDLHKEQLAYIEYSSPNIAKPMGVGHMRSTIIGQALVNLYRACGYSVIRHNYIGDWGTQFGALIYAYRTWGDEKKLEQHPIQTLKELYIRFHKESETNEELKEKARELFHALENGQAEIVALWELFRNLSIKDFKKTYARLGVEFDIWEGESSTVGLAKEVIDGCFQKGLCKKDEQSGAVAVTLEGIPSFLLQKGDGSSLYLTRDLAGLKSRIQKFHPNALLYVVGQEQELHFRQLFTLAKAMGYLRDTDVKHIIFGLVLSEGKKMATRKGTTVGLEELLNEAVEKVRQVIAEKNPELNGEERKRVAKIVGIGAVIYNDLRQSRIKNISFDWDRMLSFEGGSAPYLQYTYVRAKSILGKAEDKGGSYDKTVLYEQAEFDVVRKLLFYPQAVLNAQQADAPHILCTYLEELAQFFNTFYERVPVLTTDDMALRSSRLALISAVAQALKNGLALLNIKVPERM